MSDTNSVFLQLFNASDEIMSEVNNYVPPGTNNPETYINTSDIATKLIHAAGRWCERYASDFIISWDTVRTAIKNHVSTPDKIEPDVIAFGFRLSGVDSNDFIISRCNNSNRVDIDEYAQIYAVQVMDWIDPETNTKDVYVTLKNIKSVVKSRQYTSKTHHIPFEEVNS